MHQAPVGRLTPAVPRRYRAGTAARRPTPLRQPKGPAGRYMYGGLFFCRPGVTPLAVLFRGFTLASERSPSAQGHTPMKYSLARILSATVVGAVLTGCATVPGDPYYAPAHYPVYEQPGVVYQAPPVYRTPPVIYPYAAPPPAIYFEGRERDHNRWSPPGRERNDWRERDRDRAERDRMARERDRRDQQAREGDRRGREQARREQADQERDRRAAEAQRQRDERRRNPDAGNTMPGPHDWRARQQSNSFDKP